MEVGLKPSQMAVEAGKGLVGGAVAGVFLIGVGVVRALFAMVSGASIDWSSDIALLGGYVAIIALVGAFGRVLWVLAEDEATQMLACIFAGILGGALMMRLIDAEADLVLLLLGGGYGALMGVAFWLGGRD